MLFDTLSSNYLAFLRKVQSRPYISVFSPRWDVVSGPVAEYFGGVKEIMDTVASYNFRIGVYATRNVCQVMNYEIGRASCRERV